MIISINRKWSKSKNNKLPKRNMILKILKIKRSLYPLNSSFQIDIPKNLQIKI